MSHAAAEIIYNGSIIGHGEFNGTVDVMAWNSWYDSYDDMWSHYRETTQPQTDYTVNSENQIVIVKTPARPWLDRCSCPGIDALIYTCYGGGFYWLARICLEHRVILDGMQPWDDVKETSPIDGHPLGHKHPLDEYLVETQRND